MTSKVVNFFFVFGLLTSMSCASSGTSSTSGGGDNYYEDLSDHRPEIAFEDNSENTPVEPETSYQEVDPENDVTEEVNALLDSIAVLKKDINYIDGFTVQVYTGINREDANEARAEVYEYLPEVKPSLTYDQPNFKVKVGRFYTRREAQKTFADLKKVFPAAIIIPQRISIKNL